MKQFTQAEAIKIYNDGEWKNWTNEEIVKLQLFQDRLCVPFEKFHEAIEDVLGRPVFTHEFAFSDNLIAEYNKEHSMPTFEDICNLIPKKKLIVVSI